MATITEDYVSFETAKLLKEKGFNIETIKYWENEGGTTTIPSICELSEPYSNSYLGTHEYSCPSLYMAMKWLREVHNWTICISPYWPEGDMRNKLTWYYDIHSLIDNRSFRDSYTDNYTKACEAAIKYCLENLI